MNGNGQMKQMQLDGLHRNDACVDLKAKRAAQALQKS
jgi:hypothetical protein